MDTDDGNGDNGTASGGGGGTGGGGRGSGGGGNGHTGDGKDYTGSSNSHRRRSGRNGGGGGKGSSGGDGGRTGNGFNGGSRSRNSKDGRGSGGDFDHDDSSFPPPKEHLHPSPMLRVGEELTGMLMSEDGTSMIFASTVDASVRFYRGRGPTSAGGGSGGETHPIRGVLIESDPKEVKKVMETRRDIMEEDRRKAKGREPKKRGMLGRFKYWRKRKDRQLARDNMGECYLAISKKGVLVRNTFFPLRLVQT